MNFWDTGMNPSQVRNLHFIAFKKIHHQSSYLSHLSLHSFFLIPPHFQISQQQYSCQTSASVLIALLCEVPDTTFFSNNVLEVHNPCFLFPIFCLHACMFNAALSDTHRLLEFFMYEF